LLTGTDLTVQAIVGRCGFNHVESLRQAFISTYGVSPTHYRATQPSTAQPAQAARRWTGPT
jgi:transcriptional regulator GlxA family with amidase domain